MEWNLPTILILCGVLLALGIALVALFKSRKNSCSCCDGNCAACQRKKSD